MDYLILHEYVSPDLYTAGIEFGTEIFDGTGNLVLSEYDVEVQ